MKFEVGELAILNALAISGLPNRVGEVVEIASIKSSPNYDYMAELDNGDFVPVKEKELNKVTEEQLQLMTYIKRGNKVLYSPMNEEVEIIKVDYLHGQAEVKFYDSAMSIIGFESLRPLEYKEEETVMEKVVHYKFQVGDKVLVDTDDQWKGDTGIIISAYLDYQNLPEYKVLVREDETLPFGEDELVFVSDVDSPPEAEEFAYSKEYYLDLFFGHYENEDGSYTLPKQLLHNLLEKLI